MKKITYKKIKVCWYSDPMEYAKKFIDIPEGAELAEVPQSAGMAELDTKTIHIFMNLCCPFEELLSTVSHELGHLIEGGYKKNPPDKERYSNRHEDKANHYETFTMDAYKLTLKIFLKHMKSK
jgi:hypothetical protein